MLTAIRFWNVLHSDTRVGSEWSSRHFYERRWRRPSSPEDISDTQDISDAQDYFQYTQSKDKLQVANGGQ